MSSTTSLAARRAGAIADNSFARFLLVGGLSYVVDIGGLWILHGLLGVALPVATTGAFAVTLAVNFGLNRSLAFGSDGAVGGQLAKYLVLVGVNYVLTLAMVTGLAAAGLSYLLAKTVSTAINAVLNYVAYRWWVFR